MSCFQVSHELCGQYVTDGEGSSHRKHKKNKHKKKAKIREEDGSRVVEAEPGERPLTLKIKLGRKPPAERFDDLLQMIILLLSLQ